MPLPPINEVKRSDFIAAIEYGIANYEGSAKPLTEAEIERLRLVGRRATIGSRIMKSCAGTQAGIKPAGRVLDFGKPHDRYLIRNVECQNGERVGVIGGNFRVIDD